MAYIAHTHYSALGCYSLNLCGMNTGYVVRLVAIVVTRNCNNRAVKTAVRIKICFYRVALFQCKQLLLM